MFLLRLFSQGRNVRYEEQKLHSTIKHLMN